MTQFSTHLFSVTGCQLCSWAGFFSGAGAAFPDPDPEPDLGDWDARGSPASGAAWAAGAPWAASPAAGAFFSRERKEAKGRLGNYVS